MSVFLTPDGLPFYGGTYFPDQPRHGMPSFRQVLAGVAELWANRTRTSRLTATTAEHVGGERAAPTDLPSSSPAKRHPSRRCRCARQIRCSGTSTASMAAGVVRPSSPSR